MMASRAGGITMRPGVGSAWIRFSVITVIIVGSTCCSSSSKDASSVTRAGDRYRELSSETRQEQPVTLQGGRIGIDLEAQGLAVGFNVEGAEVRGGAGRFLFAADAYGRDHHFLSLPKVAPEVIGDHVHYRRLGVDEWFRSGHHGLEHGFDIAEKFPGSGVLQVRVASVGAVGHVHESGVYAVFDVGGTSFRYGTLVAYDAGGHELPSALRADVHSSSSVVLEVDDREATYPIRIDPEVSLWNFVAKGKSETDLFGFSVAISGDLAAVGAPGRASKSGAFSFHQWDASTAVWRELARFKSNVAGSEEGYSIGLRENTVAAGCPGLLDNQGTVFVATLNRTAGTLENALEFWAGNKQPGDRFGHAVAFSGSLIAAGAPGRDGSRGIVEMFIEDPGTGKWSANGQLAAADGAPGDAFGSAVAIWESTVLVGAPGHKQFEGAVYRFTYDSAIKQWVADGKWMSPWALGAAQFGASVALQEGLAAVGAPYASDGGRICAILPDPTTGSWSKPDYNFWVISNSWTRRGTSVALRDYWLAFGACGDHGDPGHAELASISADTLSLIPAEWDAPASSLGFGKSVAVFGNAAVVGAPWTASDTGSVYSIRNGLDRADPCSADRECLSGFCADGVCCNRRCDSHCERCDGSVSGVCEVVPDGLRGSDACGMYACDGVASSCPSSCVAKEDCVAPAQACVDAQCVEKLPLAMACLDSLQCETGYCAQGKCCDRACEGPCTTCGQDGRCVLRGAGELGEPACETTLCDGTHEECPTVCDRADECRSGYVCLDRACALGRDRGASCSDGAVCLTGHCTNGVCCSEVSCGNYRCRADGDCAEQCTSTDDCADGFVCDSSGGCVLDVVSEATPDSACGCTLRGSMGPRWLVVVGLLLLAFGRRRRT